MAKYQPWVYLGNEIVPNYFSTFFYFNILPIKKITISIIIYTINQKCKEMQTYIPQALFFHLTGVPGWDCPRELPRGPFTPHVQAAGQPVTSTAGNPHYSLGSDDKYN